MKDGLKLLRPAEGDLFEALIQRMQARWHPVEHTMMWGQPIALPAACRCDRRLTEPHSEPSCPYVEPEIWYAAEVARMAERAPA